MATKPKSLSWLLPLMSALFLLSGLTACGGGNDEVSENGGGIKVDPNIPTISEINYELSPTATIVPENVAKQITDVDTLRHKLIFPASADKPEVGQTLIINTITKELPEGLLAKVKGVKDTGSGYEVSYDYAELTEAFKFIDIPEQYIPLNDMVKHIYDMDGNEVAFTRGDDTRASGKKPIELVLPQKALKFSDIEITPKMSIDMLMRYVLQAANYEIDYVHCAIDGDITVGGDLNLKKLKEAKLLNEYIPLVTVVFGAIPVGPILITPWVRLNFIIKADGAITLEASISYKRTVHTAIHYEKGPGLSATMDIDPEAPDALKYSYGPKFEGGFSYGLGMAVVCGAYGKAAALGGSLHVLNKFTISSKIDIISLASVGGNMIDYLETVLDHKNGTKGSIWKSTKWEDLLLNQYAVIGFSANFSLLYKDFKPFNIADVNIPIDSSPIVPQVKIDEKDFFALSENSKEVTLTLHHTKKSVLDDLTEFRAVFKPIGNNDDKGIIVKSFDFDDDKRNLLKAEIKEKDVTSSAKATLNEGVEYDLTVYMNALNFDVPICIMKVSTGQESLAKVDPDDLNYKWEGESQDVVIKKGGYKHCGADVPTIYKKWISVVEKDDSTIAIVVQPNLTFENRYGYVECWVSSKANPTDEEKKKLPVVNITQAPVTGVNWEPKSLSFSANGGSEKISFEFGGFKRFGAQVHEEGYEWCAVSAANGKLTITVQPNPSTESRECIVDAYVTNSQNPTEEDKVIMPITIFQEGNDGQAAANNVTYLWGTWTYRYNQHDWDLDYKVIFGKDGSYYYECIDNKKPEESFTRKGTYKVLSYEPWNATPEGVVGLADIEESFHNSLTGNDVTRQWTITLYNNGQLGYEHKLWKAAE
jgi:hypothetical protein